MQLLALRSTVKSNRDFGELRKRNFPDLDNGEASELMKVEKQFGAKPEVYRRVGWRVLACLASLGADQRRRFETIIIAGKRIFAKDVERARGRLANGRPKREAEHARMAE